MDDQAIYKYLGAGGLTPLGRQVAGHLAGDIDEIMRERAPNASWQRP